MSIIAEWDSICPECGEWIVAGDDEICTDSLDRWVHIDCADVPS